MLAPPRIAAVFAVITGSLFGFFAAMFIGIAYFAGKGYSYNKFSDATIATIMFLCPLLFYLLTAPWKNARQESALQKVLKLG